MKQQTLTKGEMQVMNVLWDLEKGACVNDILEHFPEPKPAYTTIATFLKILTQKGFVEHKKNRQIAHLYAPYHQGEIPSSGDGRGEGRFLRQ